MICIRNNIEISFGKGGCWMVVNCLIQKEIKYDIIHLLKTAE